MDLLTKELQRYKSLSENLTKKCELIQTEVNLLNKLLFFEQKYSEHLIKDVFVLYEKHYKNLLQNYKYFDTIEQLEAQKAIAKDNGIQVKKLRQELKCWRDNNDRNEDVCKSDHSYSTGTDPMTVVRDKVLPSLSVVNIRKIVPQLTVGPNTSSASVSDEVIVAELDSIDDKSVSVKLEVIPKTEPNVSEETDTSSESGDPIIEGVEPLPPSPKTSKPFLFVSEYLSRTQAFGHLIDKNKEQTEQPIEDKSVAIDLNTDSDNEVLGVIPIDAPKSSSPEKSQSIFEDTIVDLTPTDKSQKKSSPKKNTFIKKKTKFGKKKRVLRSSVKQTESVEKPSPKLSVTPSPSLINERIVYSDRKKIHFNADNTISIVEITERPNKKLKTTNKSAKSSTESMIIVSDVNVQPVSAKEAKIQLNQKIIKSNKNIVLKGNLYYCRWKGCSYRSPISSNTIRHTWSHTGETPFKCKLCPQGFRDKRNLNKHLMAHNVNKPNGSDIGLKSGPYRERGSGNVICPECDKRFQTFMLLSKHLKRIHGLKKAQKYREEYYKQRDLLRKQQISPEVDRHKNLSPKRKSNSPPKTPKSALKSGQKSLSVKKSVEFNENQNQITIIDNNSKEWNCDFQFCTRSYNFKHNLKRHQLEIHKKLSKPLFYSTLHNSDKNFRFFIPKKSQTADTLPETVDKSPTNVEQSPVKSKIFVCNFKDCHNSYATIIGLYKHKKNVHKSKVNISSIEKMSEKYKNSLKGQPNSNPNKHYVCLQTGCTSSFQWMKSLKAHMKDKHNTDFLTQPEEAVEKPDSLELQCPHSDCAFKACSQKSLLIHFKTHFTAEDKPYICLITDCNLSFKQLCQLKNHVLNRHSEQQFYKAMQENGVNYPYF